MAGALQTAQTGDRIRRLKDGSYVDTATGKRYASYKDIPKAKANVGDPVAMRSSIRSNMGPSDYKYDTSGAPDVLDYMSGNTDILGALGATPANAQIPMGGATAARNPQPPRPAAAGPQGALSPAAPAANPTAQYFGGPGGTPFPQRPLAAADTGSESSSPLASALPMPGQAAHDPGPGGALAPSPDQVQPEVIQGGDSGGDMLSAGLGALSKGGMGGTAFGAANGAKTNIVGAEPINSPRGNGASGSPDVTKGLDLTSGLGALSQQNAPTALGHDPSWMEKIGSSIGLRKDGPSYSGSGAFDGLFDDPDRMALLEAGLGTMAAAGQPGASLGGALGAGGLGALQSREARAWRKEQERATTEKETFERGKWGAEFQQHGAEHAADRADKAADRTARTEQYTHENLLAAERIAQQAQEAGDRASYNTAQIGVDRQRNGIAQQQLTLDREKYGDARLNTLSDNYNNSMIRAQSVGSRFNPITGAFTDDGSENKPMSYDDARWAAAEAVPDAPQSKQVAMDRLKAIDAQVESVRAQGGDVLKATNEAATQKKAILQKYFPGAAGAPAKKK